MKDSLVSLFSFLGLFLFSSSLAFADWSQWRGPNRDGTVADSAATAWPASLDDATLKEQWSVDLAEGYSSPVLTADKVFTVETKDKKDEIVRAFDRATGKQLWETSWVASMKVPFFANKNGSWVRSTPATDGKHLYVLSMVDILVCLDVETGDEVWRVDFKEREGTEMPAFGGVSSPLIDGDFVYVQGGSAAAKLNRESSENVWRAMEDRRAMFGSAFSSPVIADIHGIRQIVVQTRMELGGIDPESGDVLWSTPVEAFRGMNILTPTVSGNRIFTSTYGGGCFVFEVKKGDDGKLTPELLWRKKEIEGYMSSAVIVGDHVYHLGRDKKLYCLAMADGEQAWVSDQEFGEYWSMAVNGDQVLALDQVGKLVLWRATPEKFDVLDIRKVSDQSTWAHVAVSSGQVFVRGLKQLTAMAWGEAGASVESASAGVPR
jgi:outer membrane protein assembly factor BamB